MSKLRWYQARVTLRYPDGTEQDEFCRLQAENREAARRQVEPTCRRTVLVSFFVHPTAAPNDWWITSDNRIYWLNR